MCSRTPTLRMPEKSVSRQTRIPPPVSSKWHVSWNRRDIHGLFLIRYKLKQRNQLNFCLLRCEWFCEGNGAVCWCRWAWTGSYSQIHQHLQQYHLHCSHLSEYHQEIQSNCHCGFVQKCLHLIVVTAQVVFPVEVKDPGAPVDFYINGKKAKHILSRARNGKQLDGHWTQLLV